MAGIDDLLLFIDSYVSAEGTTLTFTAHEALLARSQQIVEDLPALGEAFGRGLISCERLIEVLVPAFLKLTRKASRGQPADT